jgi:hypothetical protein
MDYSRRGQCIGDTAQQLSCTYFKEDKSGRYDVVCANNKQGRCVRNLSKNGHCTAAISNQPVCCDYRPMFCGGGMCKHLKLGMVCDA